MHTAGTAAQRVIVRWSEPQDWTQVQQVLAALLQTCSSALAQHNPDWLGHCKALAEADRQAAYGSMTGADEPLSWRGALRGASSEVVMTLYAVVYALPDDVVEAAVRSALQTHLPDALPAPPVQPTISVELW